MLKVYYRSDICKEPGMQPREGYTALRKSIDLACPHDVAIRNHDKGFDGLEVHTLYVWMLGKLRAELIWKYAIEVTTSSA
jgi:hypothetical protein